MDRVFDVIIIGAGAVGCAVARELSRYSLSVAVLEKNRDVAGETTGRNSAVVHAGFNNRPESRMAGFCVEGNEGFGELCRQLDVPFRETGKLVLAFDTEDERTLEQLFKQGKANGCKDLEILRGDKLAELMLKRGMGTGHGQDDEIIFGTGRRPVTAALWSPHTAITNPFLYCVALAENAQANGVCFFLETEVTGIGKGTGAEIRFEIGTAGAGAEKTFGSRYLINCAGLEADRIARMAGVDRYRIYPCRGEYFILDKAELEMPVYPAPRKGGGGLGVHLTPTIEGNILIGPSADYIDTRDDYACTRPVMDELLRQAGQLMPEISGLQPIGNYSGIRPKLTSPEQGGYRDFVISAEEEVPGLIDLVGIESPGLTASMPIARRVCRLIDNMEGGLRADPGFRGDRQGILRFRDQSPEKQAELIREDPDYGEIICRCQKITKREIREAIENPLGAKSVSAIKYRAWATTGRCNGGYCLPRIAEMLVREYGMAPEEICYRDRGSEMFTGRVK